MKKKVEKPETVTSFEELPKKRKAKQSASKAVKPAAIQPEILTNEIAIPGWLPMDDVRIPLSDDPQAVGTLHTDGGKFTATERARFAELVSGINADMSERKDIAEALNRNTLSLADKLREIYFKEFWRMDFDSDKNQSFNDLFPGREKSARDGFAAWIDYRLHFTIGHYDQLQLGRDRALMMLPAFRARGVIGFRSESDSRKAWTDVYLPLYRSVRAALSTTTTPRQGETIADGIARKAVEIAWTKAVQGVEAENKDLRKQGKNERMLTSSEAGKYAEAAWKEAINSAEYKPYNKVLVPALPAKRKVTSRKKAATSQGMSATDAKSGLAQAAKDMQAREADVVFADVWRDANKVVSMFANVRQYSKGNILKYLVETTAKNRAEIQAACVSVGTMAFELNRAIDALSISTVVPSTGEKVPGDKVQRMPAQEAPKTPSAKPRTRKKASHVVLTSPESAASGNETR